MLAVCGLRKEDQKLSCVRQHRLSMLIRKSAEF